MSRKKFILAVILMTVAFIPGVIFGAENCIAVANDLALNLSVVYQNVKYGTTLDFYANPYDPGGLYWKLNIATFHNLSGDSANCIPVADDLSLSLCGTYQEKNYSFTLNFAPLPHDPAGLYWKMDIDTFKMSGLPDTILVQPSDLQYLGAFRLPDQGERPLTFAYGGNAMSFNPDGDLSDNDAYPGSLFVMGHDRMPYGDLPDGNQIAEVSIPVPVINSNPANLPEAVFIQTFRNALQGQFTDLEEIPKVGMQYLNHPDTGPKIHLCWGRHLQMSEDNFPSHAWLDPTLSAPNFKGVWFIGNQNPNSVNAYMLDIPTGWADTHAQGRYLGTGRVHSGGIGGMGPALIAYRPWQSGGTAPAPGTRLQETVLLLYENSLTTEKIEKCMKGYQHPDLWEGGAWITTPSGKSAVLFAGDKSNGTKYWYGYMNPLGSGLPCIDEGAIADSFPNNSICRMADGSICPPEDYVECANHTSEKGWWSTRYDAQMILYNPEDLAKVAAGTMKSWEPQPYASIDIDEHLYLNPPAEDIPNLGAGDQRRFRIGDVAYDRINGILYILELYADGAKPVVHVWKVK